MSRAAEIVVDMPEVPEDWRRFLEFQDHLYRMVAQAMAGDLPATATERLADVETPSWA